MAAMAIPAGPAGRAAGGARITPEEQLIRLALPLAKERMRTCRMRSSLPDQLELIPQIEESAARAMVVYSRLPGLKEQFSTQVRSLFDLTTKQLVEPLPLPTKLTDWYTALARLNALPATVPLLPFDMPQILDSRCPIFTEPKVDGSHHKISDTHSLYLDPFPTINILAARVSAYGQEHLNEYGGANPFQFSYFWGAARREHGDTRSDGPQWLLFSNDLIPGSRGERYEEQVQLVSELSERAFVNYEVPSLKAAIAFPFLHKIATGNSVLQAGNDQNGRPDTYTRVQEAAQGYQLAVGGFAPDGLSVHYYVSFFDFDNRGVAALRKF